MNICVYVRLMTVKYTLDCLGFSYVWHNLFCVDLIKFHLSFKERVKDTFKQNSTIGYMNVVNLILVNIIKMLYDFKSIFYILPSKFGSVMP
jgi:hypothetical protein